MLIILLIYYSHLKRIAGSHRGLPRQAASFDSAITSEARCKYMVFRFLNGRGETTPGFGFRMEIVKLHLQKPHLVLSMM